MNREEIERILESESDPEIGRHRRRLHLPPLPRFSPKLLSFRNLAAGIVIYFKAKLRKNGQFWRNRAAARRILH
jgi:hypothetical protein